jgi:HK97 family phage prohead protease
MMNRTLRQVRDIPSQFETREDGENLSIEGYFAVFNSIYEIAPGMTESVAKGAFSRTLSGDIRALINHDTTLVLGRASAHTLELREDEHGLWGKVSINPNDTDAMNLYERVKRGDVDGCSFGFEIVKEDSEVRNDGSIHWTIEDVNLYEVSACTFPAYQETNIAARSADKAEIKKRELEAWKNKMKVRLENGTQDIASQEEAE